MTDNAPTTLRLILPQWQGGNVADYYFGARLLAWLAPPANGPVETVPVEPPGADVALAVENGILARAAVIAQTRAARAAMDRHAPNRVVTLGGDCLVDLAPMAWLNARHDGNLGVLWIDAHPDVQTPADTPHAHAQVLGALLGLGDPGLVAEVPVPLQPARVMYAGLDEMSPGETAVISALGLRAAGSAALAQNSTPVLDWIRAEGITHLAVHLDVDVLNPATFGPVLFNKPGVPDDFLAGVPRGRMTPSQVVRLLGDVARACDIVGLAIAEYLPWEAIETRRLLRQLPLLGG